MIAEVNRGMGLSRRSDGLIAARKTPRLTQNVQRTVWFVSTRARAWGDQNIAASLDTYGADAVWIIDSLGALVYSTAAEGHESLLSSLQLSQYVTEVRHPSGLSTIT
ncbi:MAG: hypothetical protein WBP29_15270 [Candidatus Zixiibacteriota bacterium]